jgi:hypothetical protein
MSGPSLNVSSALQCPHGGTVQIISANVRVNAGGVPAALATDQFIVAGCPFQIPAPSGTIPSPCVLVTWVVSDMRVRVNGAPTLSQSSVGLCQSGAQIPQGPVVIASTQTRVQSQ